MGYLKIPCISINLPIYHGQVGQFWNMGSDIWLHLPFRWRKDTHAVLTGHTGLSSAKIFTDLTEMKKEISFIHVLDKNLPIVWIRSTSWNHKIQKKLQIMEGKDHVTLVTCTPYGVNDKRLLVRGVRTAYHAKRKR